MFSGGIETPSQQPVNGIGVLSNFQELVHAIVVDDDGPVALDRFFAGFCILFLAECRILRAAGEIVRSSLPLRFRAISPVFHKAFSVPFNFFGAVAYTKRNATVSIKTPFMTRIATGTVGCWSLLPL